MNLTFNRHEDENGEMSANYADLSFESLPFVCSLQCHLLRSHLSLLQSNGRGSQQVLLPKRTAHTTSLGNISGRECMHFRQMNACTARHMETAPLQEYV